MSETLTPQDASSRRVVKHSVVIAGHRTSVSLEDAFWRALKGIATKEGVSLAALIARVDARRGDANLSSALRVFVLERALDARETPPSPSPHLSPQAGRGVIGAARQPWTTESVTVPPLLPACGEK